MGTPWSRCRPFSEQFLFICVYLNRNHSILLILYDWSATPDYLERTRLSICMCGWIHKPPFPATRQHALHSMDSCYTSPHSANKKGGLANWQCLPSIRQLHLVYVWCTEQWSSLLSSWYPVHYYFSGNILNPTGKEMLIIPCKSFVLLIWDWEHGWVC